MSVQQLREPVVADRVAAARAQVAAGAAVPAGSMGPHELPDAIADLAELESMVTAWKLELLAEADTRRLAEQEAAANSGAWAARLTGSTAAVMRGGIWLAQMLRERYEHTRVAFATGKINEAQARVIVKAAERLPEQVTDTERTQAEELLVAKAVAGTNAKNLRRAAKRMLDKVREDLTDRHEADETRREEANAEAETWFGLWDSVIGGATELAAPASSPSPSSTAACSPPCWRSSPHPAGCPGTSTGTRSPTNRSTPARC